MDFIEFCIDAPYQVWRLSLWPSTGPKFCSQIIRSESSQQDLLSQFWIQPFLLHWLILPRMTLWDWFLIWLMHIKIPS